MLLYSWLQLSGLEADDANKYLSSDKKAASEPATCERALSAQKKINKQCWSLWLCSTVSPDTDRYESRVPTSAKFSVNKKAVLSQRWPRDAPYMSSSHVSSQSRTIPTLRRDMRVTHIGLNSVPTPPTFLHVPLGVGELAFGLHEERRCWANCPCS